MSETRLLMEPGGRLVALGDSITQEGGWLRMIEATLAGQYPRLGLPPIVNAGIGGQTAGEMAARFVRDVLVHRPSVITISAGINDVWHRLGGPEDPGVLEAYGRHLQGMVVAGRAAGARVLLLTPTLIEEDPASEGNRRLAAYLARCRQVAAATGRVLVDLHGLFLEVLRRAGTGARPAGLTRDGVHMAPPGDFVMAVGVLRALGVPEERIAAAAPAREPGFDHHWLSAVLGRGTAAGPATAGG